LSQVVVPLSAIAADRLPRMCPRHGRPATHAVMRTFHRRGPAWLVPLLFLSFFAALLFGSIADERSKITCRLYQCTECARQRQEMRVAAIAVWIAFVVTFLAAISHAALILPAMVLLAAAPVASFALPRRAAVQGWVTRDRRALVLTPVSPTFVSALQTASAAT
jgi:hypothetical protein